MSKSYESQESHLLNFSQMHNEVSSHDSIFIHQLNERYGIPLVQLQNIYNESKSNRPTMANESQQLDYGQKLILNHNILKQMITLIDTKEKNILNQTKIQKKKYFKYANTSNDTKMNEIRRRLQELMILINESKDISKEVDIKKLINQQDIYQLTQQNQSLQKNKNIVQIKHKKQQNYINIDRSTWDNAKQATSRFVLSHSLHDTSKQSNQKEGLKSSLDRISQVHSGQTIQREEDKISILKNIKSQSTKSIRAKTEQDRGINQDLDETGRLILSTINKKITKISTIEEKDHESSKKSMEQSRNSQDYKNQVKNSRFWKNKNGKLDNLAINTVVSRQVIDEKRSFKLSHQKLDNFHNGFTFKSLQMMDKSSQPQLNKHYQEGRIAKKNINKTSKPQFIRYSQAKDSNVRSNTYINSLSSSNLLGKNNNNSIISQSKIITSFPSKNLIKFQRQNLQINKKYNNKMIPSNQLLGRTAHFSVQTQPSHIQNPYSPSSQQLNYSRPIIQPVYMLHPQQNIVKQQNISANRLQSLKIVSSQVKKHQSFINRQNLSPRVTHSIKPLSQLHSSRSIRENQVSYSYENRLKSIGKEVVFQKVIRKSDPRSQIIVSNELKATSNALYRSKVSGERLKKKGINITNQTYVLLKKG